MRYFILYLLFVPLSLVSLKAQNLVPNPGFEEYYSIPDGIGQIDNCKHWFNASVADADYFSSVASVSSIKVPQNAWGFQNAKDGDFYTGIYVYNKNSTNVVDYIETRLLLPLQSKLYCIEFYVSLADSACKYAVNNIGAYFSTDSIFVDTARRLTEFTPQIINPSANPLTDKTGWTKISGTFLAQGGEQYLILGNFNMPENDDTVFVGNNGQSWSGSYAYLYIDSVSVTLCDKVGINENEAEEIKVYPNPANSTLTINIGKLQNAQVELFDISERKLLQQSIVSDNETIDVSSFSNGVYICTIISNNRAVKREKIIISR